MRLRFAFIIIIIFLIGQGCSVYMAANQPDKKDVSVFNVGTPRTHVIAEAGRPIYTKENTDGTLSDTFVFVQGYSSGSKAGRAIFHGAADVFTLGLWEVIGTPVEAVADGTEVKVQVDYDANEKVQNIIALSGDEVLKGLDSKGVGKQIQQAVKEADPTEEAPKLAAIPKDAPITRISLWKKPLKINVIKLTDMLLEYDFFERSRNTKGAFVNDFVDNNDGTVTDKATGLMWQKSGSSSSLYLDAKRYIKRLHKERFAGHSDWRIPTVEELASLLEKSSKSGAHIDPVFDRKLTNCWTVDKCDATRRGHIGVWIVHFKQGQILQASFRERMKMADIGWYTKNALNYVKAVRSVK